MNWSLLGETGAALRKHGIKFPFLAARWLYYRIMDVWAESRFDRRFGVETGFIVATDELDFDDTTAQQQAVRYRPTPPFTIRQGLRKLERLSGLDFSNETFIDYGCGAGRVLIIAAEAGFGRVIGIELSPALVATCEQNLEQYRSRKTDSRLEVQLENAATYRPPDDASVYFFFVPFDAPVYQEVMNNIRDSAKRHARDIYVVEIGARLRDFSFEKAGCELIGKIEKLNIFRLPAVADRRA